MEGNPYGAFAEQLRELFGGTIVDSWVLGTVQSVSPLSVNRGGHVLKGNELLCNAQLLFPYHVEEKLKAGDTVVLLQGGGENQVYIVACKVVSGV